MEFLDFIKTDASEEVAGIITIGSDLAKNVLRYMGLTRLAGRNGGLLDWRNLFFPRWLKCSA